VLSREVLIQLIHQHLASKNLSRTIQVLENESGVKYNGYLSPSGPSGDQESNDGSGTDSNENDSAHQDVADNNGGASDGNDTPVDQKSSNGGDGIAAAAADDQAEGGANGEEGGRRDKNWSIIRTLMQIGIKDPQKPLQDVLGTGALTDLNMDSEVQTASIYNHLEHEYAHELKKGLWEELSNPDEDNVEFSDDKDREKMQKRLNDEEMEGKQLKAATLNKLVEKLTDHGQQDGKFLNTFLVTYRSFTSPEILLAKLLERYKVPKKPAYRNISAEQWDKNKVQIQIRTGNFINKWIDEFFFLDWNQQMIRMLTIFVDDFLMKDKQTARTGNTIRTKLNRKLQQQGKGDVYGNQVVDSSKCPCPEIPKNIFLKLDLFDVSEVEIARQLTRIEHEIYKRIQPSELLNQAWSKEKLRHRSPNVLLSTARFNNLSNWVACQIVEPESLKVRKTRWTKIINIAKQLYRLNNFNTLLALLSGMQNAGVHRLNWTKAELDRRTVEEYETLMAKMSSDRAYRAYRDHILSCTPPCTPYLGIYLTDLTFVEDGNPDFINSKRTGKQLINWTKRRFVHNVIAEIQMYQYKPYSIQPVYQIERLLSRTVDGHSYVDDDPLYKLSLKREPRSAKKEDLIP